MVDHHLRFLTLTGACIVSIRAIFVVVATIVESLFDEAGGSS